MLYSTHGNDWIYAAKHTLQSIRCKALKPRDNLKEAELLYKNTLGKIMLSCRATKIKPKNMVLLFCIFALVCVLNWMKIAILDCGIPETGAFRIQQNRAWMWYCFGKLRIPQGWK